MNQPGRAFSNDETQKFHAQAADLQERLAAIGINLSYDTCWISVILKWVEDQQAKMQNDLDWIADELARSRSAHA